MKYFPNLCLILFLLITLSLSGQNDIADSEEARSKVGLVLSGGGAKGFAYIGLLKVLDEVNMPIDYIGGTSIGAIVGGLYAVGYSADTIEYIIRSQNWEKVISGSIDRKYLAYEERLFSDKYKLNIPINNNKIDVKSSIAGSLHIDLLLQRFFLPVAHITDFNKLPTPFVCVGTDLITGKEVELRSGNLARAVRASMAIPGFFPEVEYNGKYLIDGGVVDNYPVEKVKAMGADIIIGGDVQAKRMNIDDISSLPVMFDHIISFNRAKINNKGINDTDYYIHFDMDYDVMSFAHFDSIIVIGERIARLHYSELKHLADSLNALSQGSSREKQRAITDSILISEIRFEGGNKLHKKLAEGFFKNVDEGYVSVNEIERSIKYLYGTKSFSEIYYTNSLYKKEPVLTVNLKPSGQGDLSAGVHFDIDYGGSILANITLRNLFNTRFKFFTDVVLGEDPRVKAQIVLNNGYKPGIAIETDIYSFDFSQYDSIGKANSTMQYENIGGSVFIPFMFRNSFMCRVGAEYNYFKYSQDFNKDTTLLLAGVFRSYTSFFGAVNYDTRNRLSFPTSGWDIEFNADHSFELDHFYEMRNYSQYSFYLKCDTYIPVLKWFTFQPGVFGGYLKYNNKLYIQETFGLGGVNTSNYNDKIVPFTGMRFIEHHANYAAIARAKLQFEVYTDFFVTGVFDYGVAVKDKSAFVAKNAMYGYGIKFGYNSIIGPVEASILESSEHHFTVFYINVGFWF